MWFTIFYYHHNDAFWHSLIPHIVACHYYHLALRPCEPRRRPNSTDRKYIIRYRKIMLSNIWLLLLREHNGAAVPTRVQTTSSSGTKRENEFSAWRCKQPRCKVYDDRYRIGIELLYQKRAVLRHDI
jgi:hypothetical protein